MSTRLEALSEVPECTTPKGAQALQEFMAQQTRDLIALGKEPNLFVSPNPDAGVGVGPGVHYIPKSV